MISARRVSVDAERFLRDSFRIFLFVRAARDRATTESRQGHDRGTTGCSELLSKCSYNESMGYRVGELAKLAGVSVDTVRFYQARGLLPPPQRNGRTAFYDDDHLHLLRKIRELASEGLSLKVIKRLLDGSEGSREGSIDQQLLARIDDLSGQRSFTRMELAAKVGVPDALLRSAEKAGLLDPVAGGSGERCYAQSDVEMLQAGLRLLDFGLPADELAALAADHARNVDAVAERSVEMFNAYIRRNEEIATAEDVVGAFDEMLAAVTSLVALHFQRVLMAKGRSRLAEDESADARALEVAIAAAGPPKLRLQWS